MGHKVKHEFASCVAIRDSIFPARATKTNEVRIITERIKKTTRAKFAIPLAEIVEIQPIGLGATIALNGSNGN